MSSVQLDDALRQLVGVDEALADRVRIAIMIYLVVRGRARFKELQEGLGLTPGNLAFHLKRLEEKGYVKIKRSLLDARGRVVIPTQFGLTALFDLVSLLRRAVEAIVERRGASPQEP